MFFLISKINDSGDKIGSSECRVRDYDEGGEEKMVEVTSSEEGEEVDQPEEIKGLPQPSPLNVVFPGQGVIARDETSISRSLVDNGWRRPGRS